MFRPLLVGQLVSILSLFSCFKNCLFKTLTKPFSKPEGIKLNNHANKRNYANVWFRTNISVQDQYIGFTHEFNSIILYLPHILLYIRYIPLNSTSPHQKSSWKTQNFSENSNQQRKWDIWFRGNNTESIFNFQKFKHVVTSIRLW